MKLSQLTSMSVESTCTSLNIMSSIRWLINNQSVFHVWSAGKSKIKGLVYSAYGENHPCLSSQTACVLIGALWGSLS